MPTRAWVAVLGVGEPFICPDFGRLRSDGAWRKAACVSVRPQNVEVHRGGGDGGGGGGCNKIEIK